MLRITIQCILLISAATAASDCELPQVYCLSESTYSLKVIIFGKSIDFGITLYCPEGYYCQEASDTPPPTTTISTTEETSTTETTTEEITTTSTETITPSDITTEEIITTTTTTKPITSTTIGPPICEEEGYHQANKCNEYYQCVKAMWWYDLKLKTCKTGYYYSSKNPPCDKPPNVVCTN